MTFAVSSAKVRKPMGSIPARAGNDGSFFAAWQLLPVVLVALIAFLVLTPDDMAEPVQHIAGWLVVGGVATLAVQAIAKGLERLLDCEGN